MLVLVGTKCTYYYSHKVSILLIEHYKYHSPFKECIAMVTPIIRDPYHITAMDQAIDGSITHYLIITQAIFGNVRHINTMNNHQYTT